MKSMQMLWVTGNRIDTGTCFIGRIELIKYLNNLGHNTQLVANRESKKRDFGLNGKIMYLPRARLKTFRSISYAISLNIYLFYYILFKKPDVVIMDCPYLVPLILLFNLLSKADFIKTKFILDIRSVPVETAKIKGEIDEMKYKYSVRYSKFFFDGITTVTSLLKKQICNDYNINENKVGIWSSGVSLETFNFEGIDHINDPPFCNKEFIVMYHGALSQSRGLQETVKAIKLLKSKRPDIVFFILGDGRAKSKLELLIKELNLGDNVFLHKSVPYEDVPKYIASCDVGILPFPNLNWWRVSSPLKLMEYLAMGKPVIVTDIEAHREVLNNSPCGIFIKSNNPEEIAQGIIRAYTLKDNLKEIGKIGREIVAHNYTWKKQVDNLINFLESLQKKKATYHGIG